MNTKKSKLTIADVAKHAKVSISVVSNVLNHPDKVAESTIQTVRKSMEILGWFPTLRRRGPKNLERQGVKTGNLALLMMPAVPTHIYMNQPTNTELIYSLIHEANSLGFTLTIIDADPNYLFDADLLKRLYDGVLVYGPAKDRSEIEILKTISDDIPAVWIRRKNEASDRILCDFVYYDNDIIGPMAAEYFKMRGHTRVAAFSVSIKHREYVTRLERFFERANELGIKTDVFTPSMEMEKEQSKNNSYYKIYSTLTKIYMAKSRAGALFCCSDDCMLGICNELRNMNVKLNQLDLLSCNHNKYILQYFAVPPPSIDIRFTDVGANAIQHLLKIMNGKIVRTKGEYLAEPCIIK